MTYEQLERALGESQRTGERLGEILLRRKELDERQLAVLLARQWQLPFLDDGEARLHATALTVLSAEDARQTGAVPLASDDDGVVRVAVVEPTEKRVAEVRARASEDVAFAVVARTTLGRLLAALDQPSEAALDQPSEAGDESSEASSEARDEQPGRGADDLIALLEDEARHLEAIREKVAHFGDGVTERERTTRRLESELDAERDARAHDRHTIDQLRREAEARARLLDLVRGKVDDLAGTLGNGSAH